MRNRESEKSFYSLLEGDIDTVAEVWNDKYPNQIQELVSTEGLWHYSYAYFESLYGSVCKLPNQLELPPETLENRLQALFTANNIPPLGYGIFLTSNNGTPEDSLTNFILSSKLSIGLNDEEIDVWETMTANRFRTSRILTDSAFRGDPFDQFWNKLLDRSNRDPFTIIQDITSGYPPDQSEFMKVVAFTEPEENNLNYIEMHILGNGEDSSAHLKRILRQSERVIRRPKQQESPIFGISWLLHRLNSKILRSVGINPDLVEYVSFADPERADISMLPYNLGKVLTYERIVDVSAISTNLSPRTRSKFISTGKPPSIGSIFVPLDAMI